MLSRAVADYYRCPEGFLQVGLTGDLSGNPGFFRFGPDAICYGRTSAETHRKRGVTNLDDAVAHARFADGRVDLPFDPSEVIENLRLERYLHQTEDGNLPVLRKIYYSVRPFTTLPVRKFIQRFHARRGLGRSFPHWPVDTTVENLCESLLLMSLQAGGIDRVPFIWFWPRGARGCVTMTHDVENTAGLDFCETLMDIDEAFGFKAAFQIVPEERYDVPRDLLDSMKARQFEVAVQDLNHDGRLFDDRQEFLRRVDRINHYGREFGARGFRAGVLYRKPEWFDALEFSYDMSIPNVAHLDPQRGGCCTVMPYFIGNLLEIPVTTVQDYTLFHILNEDSISLWKTQTDLILRKHGLASFIVHPDYVIEPAHRRLYEELLSHLRDLQEREGLWIALPHEIDGWWRARSEMSLVADDGDWRIVGVGAEAAVVAYARNVDGKLVYEVPEASKRQHATD